MPKPTIIVTGISGILGGRLARFLSEYEIVGVDVKPPKTQTPMEFFPMDLSKEESCLELTSLIQKTKATGVVHLAFLAETRDFKTLDQDHIWHNNVAGTARVMEAVTEANRELRLVEKFVYPSSAVVYGPNLPERVTEDTTPLADSPAYGRQFLEADTVVRERAPALRGCSVFMLRPQPLVGADFPSYITDALGGVVQGNSRRANRMRAKGEKLGYVLPFGEHYLQKRKQFVHVDDLLRLITYLLARTEPESQRLTILNLAGRGDAPTVAQCLATAGNEVRRVPGVWAAEAMIARRWNSRISAVPPDAFPYLAGESVLNTDRLVKFLGSDYENVIHYTNAAAFSNSLLRTAKQETQPTAV